LCHATSNLKPSADKVTEIVTALEGLQIAKHTVALEQASTAILKALGIGLTQDALDILVQIAVSYLPKTN
jgi:hypothetical protein